MKIAVCTDLYLEMAGGIPSSISAQKKELEKLLELFPEDTEVKIVTAAVDNETVPSSFDPIPKTKVAIVFPGVFPG